MTSRSQRIRLGIGTAMILVLTIASTHPFAQNTNDPQGSPAGRHGGRFGGPGGRGGPLAGLMLGALNLTDAQKAQVQSIMQAHQDEMKALGDRAMAARTALQAATANASDEASIRARSADLAAVHSDMAVTRGRIRAEVFQILTPEQQALAQQAQARMQQRMQSRGRARPPQ